MAFSGLYDPIVDHKAFADLCLNANSIFEPLHTRLDVVLRWQLMPSYIEQKANRQNIFKLSLIGFMGSNALSPAGNDALSVK
jgi:hypothetical protein